MIEFNWELNKVLLGIKKGLLVKQSTFFLRPHDAIWGEIPDDFSLLAEKIMSLLTTEQMRRQFLSVCLGSYLLNPSKAPKAFPDWIQSKISVAELLGYNVSLLDLLSLRWDRAAFPVLDEFEDGKNDTIYYALIAESKSGSYPLYPSWVLEVMNSDALDAITIAAELARKAHCDSRFFFLPFINPRKPTHDRSLGLPIYLSFLSLAKGKPVPMIIATGEVDRQGVLHSVYGAFNKCDKAFEKKYKKFIYPEDGSYIERRREQRPVGVTGLDEAEYQWGVRDIDKGLIREEIFTASKDFVSNNSETFKPSNTKKVIKAEESVTVVNTTAKLTAYVEKICEAVLGTDDSLKVTVSAYAALQNVLPSNVNATHEYMIFVDFTKACQLILKARKDFASFLGKEIFDCEAVDSNWLYWGEGELLSETGVASNIQYNKQPVELPSSSESSWLKTDTVLPKWLDQLLFGSLGACYQPDYVKFAHNLDLNADDLKIYLGTYFPRSYAEAFCILDDLFGCDEYSELWANKTEAWILDIGTGTGGNLIGLLTALAKHFSKLKTIHIHGHDGNVQALDIARKILEVFSNHTNSEIAVSLKAIRIDTLDQMPTTTHKSYDFISSCKMGAEIITKRGNVSDSFYLRFLSSYMNLLSDVGLFLLLDVTTKTEGIDFFPQLLNEQVSHFLKSTPGFATVVPVSCYINAKDCEKPCFTQKEFSISHCAAKNDLSRVAYRILARKSCADVFHRNTVKDAAYVVSSRASNSTLQTCSYSPVSSKQLDGFKV